MTTKVLVIMVMETRLKFRIMMPILCVLTLFQKIKTRANIKIKTQPSKETFILSVNIGSNYFVIEYGYLSTQKSKKASLSQS